MIASLFQLGHCIWTGLQGFQSEVREQLQFLLMGFRKSYTIRLRQTGLRDLRPNRTKLLDNRGLFDKFEAAGGNRNNQVPTSIQISARN